MVADNDVTVRYLLEDEVTGGLKRMEGQAEATDRRLKTMGGGNGPLLTMFDALDGKIGNVDRQLASLDRTAMSTSRTMQRDLLVTVRDLSVGLVAAAGAADYFGLKSVNSFQHTQAAFSVLTGSMANGQRLYNQLLQLNLKSPFDQQPLATSAQTLLGFQIPQRNLLPILTSISNVAAVQQDPNEALMRMSLAVGQINQSGTVRAQDLNQLVQAGFPAYRLIPGGKAGLLAGHGTLPSGRFLNQLTDPSAGPLAPYSGAAAAMNNTLSGQWSNLTTLVRQEAIKAFSPLGDQLVKEMPNLTKVISGEVADLAPALGQFGSDMIHGVVALLPIIDPIVKSLLHGIHELSTAGAPFFHELRAQEPQVVAALDGLFKTLAGDAPEIGAFFGDMVQLLPPFIHGLGEMVQIVDPVLKLVDGLLGLGPVRTIVGDLLLGLLAYRTLAPATKAVLGMRDALFGLATAEEAATVAGSGGGVGGMGGRTYGRGGRPVGGSRFGKAAGIVGGLSLLVPGMMDGAHGGGRGLGSDLSTVGGAALTGFQVAGPMGAFAAAMLGTAWDLGVHLGGHGGAPSLSQPYLDRSAMWSSAMMNDPRLQRMLTRGNASINFATGAIVVHDAKDPVATAKAIRDEMDRYAAEQQDRR